MCDCGCSCCRPFVSKQKWREIHKELVEQGVSPEMIRSVFYQLRGGWDA